MGSGIIYTQVANTKKNVKRFRLVRMFFLAGILLFTIPFHGFAQAPQFVNGSDVSISVCSGSGIDIDSVLAVIGQNGQNETWTVSGVPSNGTLGGFPYGPFPVAGANPTDTLYPVFGSLTYTSSGTSSTDQFQIEVTDGNGTAFINVAVQVNGTPSITLSANPVVCTGQTSAAITFSGVVGVGAIADTQLYIGFQQAPFIVPTGISSISFDVYGASGGNDNVSTSPNPGKGARVQGTLPVTPGDLLYLYAGGQGSNGTASGAPAGFNGGGAASFYSAGGVSGSGGGGGDASDIRLNGNALSNRVVVAGGGAGNGLDSVLMVAYYGGDGGGLSGVNGQANDVSSFAGGGTQAAGGAGATYVGANAYAPGSDGTLANGGAGSIQGISGGGGGGYYGGGGGMWSGGGGGSSYTASVVTSPVATPGYNTGSGLVVLTYTTTGTYTITWDASTPTSAHQEGFTDILSSSLPGNDSFMIVVPATATANTYNAILTVTNGICSSSYPISVTVNQTPDVVAVPNVSGACSGSPVNINFSSTLGTPTYNWAVDNSSIGGALTNTGSGNISFTAANATSGPLTGVFTVTPTQAGCTGASTSFAVTTNPLPALTLGTFPQVCAGATSATLPFSGLQNVGPFTNTFSYHGGNPIPDTFVVPNGITTITFDAAGGIGGSDDMSTAPNPGKGGRIQGVINVTSGQPLSILVGGAGFNGSPFGAAGGFNGGGVATYYGGAFGGVTGCGGGGGGASDIRSGGTALSNRIIVAAGGGGTGFDSPVGGYAGGNGGGLSGANSANNVNGSSASGGTQNATGGAGAVYPGWVSGGDGGFGFGGAGSTQGVSGGGGAGYYGGGGGIWTGGGGGSSFADPVATTLVTYSPGANIGNGYVVLSYTTVGTYSIDWDPAAASAGFVPVSSAPLPTGNFTIALPTSASPAMYTATLTIDNGVCTNMYPIQVTVNPLPIVSADVPTQSVCNGAATTAVNLTEVTGLVTTKFYWANDNTSIGLEAADSTSTIGSFTAIDTSSAIAQVANVAVTPIDTATGCAGAVDTFRIIVNPTPSLNSSLAPPAICDASLVTYMPTTADTATTIKFAWSRAAMSGISNPLPGSGMGSPLEVLVDTLAIPFGVPYIYTITDTVSTCFSIQTVTVTVYPEPSLTTPLKDSICSGDTLNYTPMSLTPGTTYAWVHDVPAGLTVPSTSGVDSVHEMLGSISPAIIAVNYTFIMTAYGCTNGELVQVFVKPIPLLSSSLTPPAVCSGVDSVIYNATSPTSATETVTFNWNRIVVPGVIPATNLGAGDIHELLTDTTLLPVTVLYEYDLNAMGCLAPPVNVAVTVNPIPKFTSSLYPPAICTGTTFNYTPTSSTPGDTFAWIRPLAYGIKENHMTGIGNVSETLTDTTVLSDTAMYIFTTTYKSCVSSSNDTVRVAVNPSPMLTSSFADTAICDSIGYSYIPESSTPGATYTWSRPFVPGIDNLAETGTGIVTDMLTNSTYTDVTTSYTIAVSANGCAGDTMSFNVTVHPTPKLSSTLTPHYVCNGQPFVYYPSSYTPGAIFDWTRPHVAGVNYFPGTLATNFGTGNISEALYDSNFTQHTVTYNIRLTANGCTNLHFEQVKLVVNPGPQLPAITSTTPASPCTNIMYQTYGAASPPATDVTYDWYANNATVWSMTANHQFAYVNFTYPGTAYVRLEGTIGATGCKTYDSVFVNVGTGVADNPQIIRFEGEFICLQSNMDTYQWGYDDAATFASVTIPGATQQNYYDPTPDLTHNRYWVITSRNGCVQKSYYNNPLAVTDVNAVSGDLKIYPNPAKDNINVEIITNAGGEMQVEILDLLGQRLTMVPAVNHKATIDVASLPGGCYLVNCYRDGIKIATSRFIKN